jgi:hypothetical protein
MPRCTADQLGFGRLGGCVIEANFEGGLLSFDDGLMLSLQVDRKMGLSKTEANAPRRSDLIRAWPLWLSACLPQYFRFSFLLLFQCIT